MDGEDTSGGTLERLRNSPRTVSTVIVILIIAGAIFMFSGREDEQTAAVNDESVEVIEEERDEDAEENEDADEAADIEEEELEEVEEVATPAPQTVETADAFVETAGRGDGVTHLARRAASAFLEANPADFEVTGEHRVFIEDYITKRVGSRPLAIGEEVAVSKELAQEAISASRELSDAQLQNLERFSQRVDWN